MFEVDFDATEDSEKSKMDRFLGPEGEDPSNLESESVQAKAGGDLPDVLKSKIERLGAEPRPDVPGFPEDPGADVPGL